MKAVLRDEGLCPYPVAYQLQLDLVRAKKHRVVTEDVLILVEHPEVYTFGRKSRSAPLIEGFPAFGIERGGEVTYHNPGQLVGYPILSLEGEERDLHLHLRRIESLLIDVLAEFGVQGDRREGATGVWIQEKSKKIASIGVAVSGWITYHGFALNLSNDLTGFSRIQPCGFSSDVMTSLSQELGEKSPSMSQVKEAVVRCFQRHFNRQIVLPDPHRVR